MSQLTHYQWVKWLNIFLIESIDLFYWVNWLDKVSNWFVRVLRHLDNLLSQLTHHYWVKWLRLDESNDSDWNTCESSTSFVYCKISYNFEMYNLLPSCIVCFIILSAVFMIVDTKPLFLQSLWYLIVLPLAVLQYTVMTVGCIYCKLTDKHTYWWF